MGLSTPHRVLFGGTSLWAGTGGIQRVSRMMARVLSEHPKSRDCTRYLSLLDHEPPPDLDFPIRVAGGSKFAFARRAMFSRCTHLITDGCHVAQVARLPGLRNKPLLTFLHGIEIWENARPGYIRAAKAATLPLFNSEYTRRRAERLHGEFPRAVICPLATEADAPPDAPPNRQRPEVLIVGRITERERYKGHHELIEAWPAVVAAVPDARLRVVGKGTGEQELKDLAAKTGVTGSILFDGFVPEEKLDSIYAGASVFAMPSRGEGFGLVYVEAMRHGLPVITCAREAGAEVIREGETGFAVDLEKPGELADRLINLLRDPDLAERMGQAGRRHWANNYRFTHFQKRFIGFLDAFLE